MESGAFSTKRGTRPFRCCMTGSAPFPKGWRQPKKTGNGGFSIRRAISSSRLSTIPQWEKDSPTGSYRSGKTAGKGIWIKPDAWRFYWIPDMRPCVVFTADLPSWRRIRLPAGKPETGPAANPARKPPLYGAIDRAGRIVVPAEYASVRILDGGFVTTGLDGRKRFLDPDGQTVLAADFEEMGDFSEGLAAIKRDGAYGYADKTGQVVIPCAYSAARRLP